MTGMEEGRGEGRPGLGMDGRAARRRGAFPARLWRRRRRGLSLFGSLLAMGVWAVLMLGLVTWGGERLREDRVLAAARQLGEVAGAARAYGRAEFSALVDGGEIADEVRDYLPPAFPDRDVFGRAFRVYVREASADVFEVLATVEVGVVAPVPMEAAVFDRHAPARLGVVRGRVLRGPSIRDHDVSAFRAAHSGHPRSGAPAILERYDEASLFGEVLYRSDLGLPGLNRMETGLDMDGHDIDGAGAYTGRELSLSADLQVGGRFYAGGPLTVAGALTAGGAEVAGAVSAGSAALGGALRVGGSAEVGGAVRAVSADIEATLRAGEAVLDSAVVRDSVTARSVTVSGEFLARDARIDGLSAGSVSVEGRLEVGSGGTVEAGEVRTPSLRAPARGSLTVSGDYADVETLFFERCSTAGGNACRALYGGGP